MKKPKKSCDKGVPHDKTETRWDHMTYHMIHHEKNTPNDICVSRFSDTSPCWDHFVSIQHLLVAATAQASLVDFPVPQIRGLWHVLVALKIRRFLHHPSRKLM